MPRIEIGGYYESESEDNDLRARAWIDVSSALMNEVTAKAVEDGEDVRTVLSEFISGERQFPNDVDPDEYEASENESDEASDSDSEETVEA